MIPKEKAKELFFKMSFETHAYNAKHCALIAVNEIIQHIETSYHNEDIIKGSKLYWQEVKQEIERL
jgi:hypothetical protein